MNNRYLLLGFCRRILHEIAGLEACKNSVQLFPKSSPASHHIVLHTSWLLRGGDVPKAINHVSKAITSQSKHLTS